MKKTPTPQHAFPFLYSWLATAIIALAVLSCQGSNLPSTDTTAETPAATSTERFYTADENIVNGIYKAAIDFNNSVVWQYDPTYYRIPYPNGDVPSGGACTDVVIRVLRKNNIDLQQRIHEDMSGNFSSYPNKWRLSAPDPNIDHRRVPNIMKYFGRKGYDAGITDNDNDYQPGDIVCWELSPGITHIGIVLDKGNVFHNMGPSSRIESDFLFAHRIIGHYRIPL